MSAKRCDDRVRQCRRRCGILAGQEVAILAAVAAFAALGEPAFLKVHAGYALNTGVTEAELKEIVYLTTVTAGFPKAIVAWQALSELFAERRAARTGGPLP